jgi:hypothetical protein
MLEVISSRARTVSPAGAQGRALRVVPILGSSHQHPAYELLRPETLAGVKVSEVSQSGSVPELHVENALDLRVFLMDGQELIGAKQNRVLNTDVMVPAKSKISIPVSCVEQGRWHPVSANFVSGKTAPHRTRSAKAERVRMSLKAGSTHDADQSAVWDEVAMCLEASGAASPTGALSAAYAKRESELIEFRSSLAMPPDAVGLAVMHGGKMQGLDLFDRHSTLSYFWESLLDSYAIDFLSAALNPDDPKQTEESSIIRAALDRAAGGKWEGFDSPGEGRDWRLEDDQLTGAALVCEDVVIHMQLFPKQPATSVGHALRYRPRIRRRYAEGIE